MGTTEFDIYIHKTIHALTSKGHLPRLSPPPIISATEINWYFSQTHPYEVFLAAKLFLNLREPKSVDSLRKGKIPYKNYLRPQFHCISLIFEKYNIFIVGKMAAENLPPNS